MNNKKSKSQYNNLIINEIKNNNYKNLIFLFGGVDLEFVFIDKYINNNNMDYKEFNLDVIDNYLNFILQHFKSYHVTILSIGLPCIDDKYFIDNYINNGGRILNFEDINILNVKMSKIIPDLLTRTQITLHFNEKLNEQIIKLNNPNIEFLDITSFTYDETLKIIKNEYFSRTDYHNYIRNIFFSKIIDDHLSNLTI